uniref:Probable protein-export membrane protein SecG n=1 Tax=Laurencia australis TaxID=3073067 RepID=A0AA51NF34_9FLOR|nr:probable protein-export membrane protein SecG [Laurencia australis]WMP12070.1 Probable protein-export membrane protein SecG [Laurencia australis]
MFIVVKLIFYCISVLTIVLIIFFSPVKKNMSGFLGQSRLFNSGYNQVLMQKIIAFSVILFFVLILVLLFQVS